MDYSRAGGVALGLCILVKELDILVWEAYADLDTGSIPPVGYFSYRLAVPCQPGNQDVSGSATGWISTLQGFGVSNVSLPTHTVVPMPRISSFYGISILMFFGDHHPPHFHARYSGHVARIALDGTVLDGHLPRRALRLVRDWTRLHREDPEVCWDRAVNHEPPGTIDPLP